MNAYELIIAAIALPIIRAYREQGADIARTMLDSKIKEHKSIRLGIDLTKYIQSQLNRQ